MDWTFSIGWLFLGILIVAAGAAVTYFYKPIADNMVHGINSYDHVKLAGIITIGIGLLVMTNLHTAILSLLVNLIWHR